MTVSKELKEQCQAEMDRCMAIARKEWPDVNFPRPFLVYDLRGRTAGTAQPTSGRIRINAVLLRENVKEMVENTVSHEVAHIVDRAVYGVQYGAYDRRVGRRRVISHGKTFKSIQRLFGRCDKTYHNMDTTNSAVRRNTKPKHVWKCGCGEATMLLGDKRHAKQMRLGERGFYMRGHTVRRCGPYSYYGLEGQEIQPMQLFEAAKKPAPKDTSGESKLDKCRRVYDPELSRAANIVAFVEEGCTEAGAATYYAKIKKEFGA